MDLLDLRIKLKKIIYLNSFLMLLLTFSVIFVAFYFNKKDNLEIEIEKATNKYLQYLEKENKNSLKVVKEFINTTTEKLTKKQIPKKQIQKEILDYLRDIRFGENNENYIFILEVIDLNGGKKFAKEILLPIKPKKEGSYLSDEKQDIKGRYYRKEYLNQIRQNGEAVVYYSYIKDKNSKEIEKVSYLVYIEDWNWIIGTGTYLDHFEKIIAEYETKFKKELTNELIYFSMALLFFGLLSVLGTLKLINKMKYVFNTYEEYVLKYKNLSEQYRETIDMSAIVSKTNPEGLITYANNEFCNISGYSKEELIGQPHNIIRHPDNSDSLYEQMWQTIKIKKKPWKGEFKNKAKDGTTYWVKSIINPILDSNNNIVEYIAIRTDISKLEEMTEYFKTELNISNKQFTHVLQLSKEYEKAINKTTLMVRTDINYNITYTNRALLTLLGYKKTDLLGQKYHFILSNDTTQEVIDEIKNTIVNGQIWRGVLKYTNQNKKIYWLDSNIVPIKDENGAIVEYMSICHNLTEIFELHKEIEDTQREIIYKLGEIGETRSKETGNHVKRVAEYSYLLAKLYGLSQQEADILYTASPMHDIGKVGIPDKILKKPAKLTQEEFKIMKEHSIIGKRILVGSNRPVLQAATIVAYEHHEKWDGSGYPRGIKGQDIHIYGRITAVADVFDALGSDRCYKKAWKDKDIFDLFKEQSGKHFEPKLVELFLTNKEKFLQIRDKYAE